MIVIASLRLATGIWWAFIRVMYVTTLFVCVARGDEVVMRQLKPKQSANNPSQKRHSSIMDEDDFNRTYSVVSDELPE